MSRVKNLLRTFLVFVFAISLSETARGQVYEGRELVKAELLADTNAIVPGKPFTVGLLLHMVPGWHTYWKFPGDAGIPTEMKWNLPPGWKVDPIQWPIPLKIDEPGDIQIYGYHDEVLLMQQITPPASIADKNVNLQAEASWLVCEKICIPGSAKLQLSLPVTAESAPANEEMFSRYRRSLPQPAPDPKVASFSWQRNPADLVLTLTSQALANYSSVEFFPLPEGNVVVGHPKTESIARMAKFKFGFRLNRRKRKSVRSTVLSFSVAPKMETIATHGYSILRPKAFRHRHRRERRRFRRVSPNFFSSDFSADSS